MHHCSNSPVKYFLFSLTPNNTDQDVPYNITQNAHVCILESLTLKQMTFQWQLIWQTENSGNYQ